MFGYQNTRFMTIKHYKMTQTRFKQRDLNCTILWKKKVIYLKYDQKLA